MQRFYSRITLAATFAAALLAPQVARAHAILVDSTPKANETVHGASVRVDLKFNSRVDASGSTVQMAAPDGSVRTLELSTQTQPDEILTQADGLSKGSYTLRWQALATDGHITRGQIPFQVE